MEKGSFSVTTSQFMELVDISGQVAAELAEAGVAGDGILHLFNPHTTAGLTINEGADPTVRTDIIMALKEIIPFELPFRHLEGNSPSHVLASLFGASETIFVEQGRLLLGTWQKIYFCEFDGGRSRKVHWRFTP
ncbi:MAG: secondary thiamine-phosphate synthase enzyme YjbQ [Thermodesulfobacteriota bacterium]